MKNLILNFADQIELSLDIAAKNALKNTDKKIKNVVISGLGGSGIAATVLNNLIRDLGNVPVIVVKDYVIPKFVDEKTLFIASSYSGNTEETIATLNLAMQKNAEIVCVTSGGKIEEIAKNNDLNLRLIPGGNPPRACFGYSIVQLIDILTAFNIIDAVLKEDLLNVVSLLKEEALQLQTEAQDLANKLKDKIVLIYSENSLDGASIRFRQQLNENSKMLAWNSVIPEMNHNELVGWNQNYSDLAVVFVENPQNDYLRNRFRKKISEEIISKYNQNIFNFQTKGKTLLQNTFYYIHFGDLVSLYLSELNHVDILDITAINYLKTSLDGLN